MHCKHFFVLSMSIFSLCLFQSCSPFDRPRQVSIGFTVGAEKSTSCPRDARTGKLLLETWREEKNGNEVVIKKSDVMSWRCGAHATKDPDTRRYLMRWGTVPGPMIVKITVLKDELPVYASKKKRLVVSEDGPVEAFLHLEKL